MTVQLYGTKCHRTKQIDIKDAKLKINWPRSFKREILVRFDEKNPDFSCPKKSDFCFY
jgi:hypothetical protein